MILCHHDIISQRTGKTAVCCRSIFTVIFFMLSSPMNGNVKYSVTIE